MKTQAAPGDTPYIGTWIPRELAKRIHENSWVVCDKPDALADAAATLHRELECANEHTEGLVALLRTGRARIVRFAHQPNLFPYAQVGAQTVYLARLAEELLALGDEVVPTVLLVDYDVPNDKWMRLAYVPDCHAKQHLREFKITLDERELKTPAHLIPAPDAERREQLQVALEAYASRRTTSAEFLLDATGVGRNARSLADFNAYAWVKLAICLWRLPILFLRLSDVLHAFEAKRDELILRLARDGGGYGKFVWSVCTSCRRRVAHMSDCCGDTGRTRPVLPRVLLDDLSDYALMGVAGGTCYESGRDHITESHRIASAAGVDVAFESCWRLDDRRLGTPQVFGAVTSERARKVAETGRWSMIAQLLSADSAEALKRHLASVMNDGAPLM